MTLHWPQLTLLFLWVLGLGLELALHKKPRIGAYNFWAALIVRALLVFLLYKGGFFAGVTA
jgi:hypothetical protein